MEVIVHDANGERHQDNRGKRQRPIGDDPFGMSGVAPVAARQPTWRLILFAFGDFGFNLYWQSLMLFLLFYYTDTLGVSMGVAAAIYMAASVLDGVSGFLLGIWFDRRGSVRVYPAVLVFGAVPLGMAFVLAYLPMGGQGRSASP